MTRKICTCLLCVAILLCSVPAYAADTARFAIASEAQAQAGSTLNATVELIGGREAVMLQFAVRYDASRLALIGAGTGMALSGNTAPTINSSNAGVVYFVWDSLQPVGKDGSLLELRFAVAENAGEAALWFDKNEEFIIANNNFEELPYAVKETGVAIKPPAPTVPSENMEFPGDNTKPLPPATPAPQVEGYNNGITLDANALTVNQNDTVELSLIGQDITPEQLVWASSNEAVATVENGKVITHGAGEAIITVVTEAGTGEAVCVVNVLPTELPAQAGESTQQLPNGDAAAHQSGNTGKTVGIAVLILAVLGAGIAGTLAKKKSNIN